MRCGGGEDGKTKTPEGVKMILRRRSAEQNFMGDGEVEGFGRKNI